MANCCVHAIRIFHHDAHCVQHTAADDEGKNFKCWIFVYSINLKLLQWGGIFKITLTNPNCQAFHLYWKFFTAFFQS